MLLCRYSYTVGVYYYEYVYVVLEHEYADMIYLG